MATSQKYTLSARRYFQYSFDPGTDTSSLDTKRIPTPSLKTFENYFQWCNDTHGQK